MAVGGIGGRVLMRIAAVVAPDSATGALTENENVIGDITTGGSLELLIFEGIFVGGGGALTYVISERWLGWTGPLRPLAFALLLLAVGSPIALDPDNVDFLLVENQGLIVAMFMALFLLYAIPLPSLVRALEARLPRVNPERPVTSVAGYLSLVGLGTIFVPLLLSVGLDEEEPAILLLLLLGLATLARWGVEFADAIRQPWPAMARLTGYVTLIAAVTVGTIRTASAVADILANEPL
ncbi:MAG: hypothetical protein WD939_03445 [Dehalococcoidia bacterium]